jgi:hypothetical protein
MLNDVQDIMEVDRRADEATKVFADAFSRTSKVSGDHDACVYKANTGDENEAGFEGRAQTGWHAAGTVQSH